MACSSISPRSPGSSRVSVRYARVVAQSQPFARRRLLVEGQLTSGASSDPAPLGASIGVAAEYQEPYIYATGGVRFSGRAGVDGDGARIDVAPFVGAGFRLWRTVRIGGEATVLLPVTGHERSMAGGVTVGVEFK